MPRLFRVLSAVLLMLPLLVGVAHANAYPMAMIRTPTLDGSVEPGTPVLIAGSAVNGESGGIVSVEISFDGGANWEQTEYENELWSYLLTPTEPGTVTFVARASTNSVVGSPTAPVTLHVGAPGTLHPVSSEAIFGMPTLPGRPRINEIDDLPVEVGVRTRIDRAGRITGAIIYRGSYTGSMLVRVWAADGTILGQQTSTPGSYSQRVMFSTPVPVSADTEYVVSYYTPEGGYAQSENYFTGTVISNPFTAPVSAGVYRYGAGGGFPTDTWHDANYWVEPIFAP